MNSTDIISLCVGGAGVLVGIIALFNKQRISPQPLAIKIVQEIHELFTTKKEFEEHKKQFSELATSNTQRHGQLFSQIKAVDDKVSTELTTIKEKVAALQVETKMQSTQLDKLDGLEKEIRDMPEKVIQNIVNAQSVGRIK